MSVGAAHPTRGWHRPARQAFRLGALLALLATLSGLPLRAQSLFGLGGEAPPLVEPVVPARLPDLEPASMIEFYVSPTTTNRFSIDASSIAVDQGRMVRFALLVTSRSGARNVSYEAIRCDRRERKLLALGRTDGSWSITADSPWRPIAINDSVNRQHLELFNRLCAGGAVAAQKPQALRERLLETPTIGP
jgi:hypothetical protein